MTLLSGAKKKTVAFLSAVIVAIVGCHPMQETVERGQQAEREAKKLQAASAFQKPSTQAVETAIRSYETGKTDIQSVEITSLTQQEQFDKYIVKARVNGEERTYGLERDAAGTWTATPPPQ
jgi:hypothetical protein